MKKHRSPMLLAALIAALVAALTFGLSGPSQATTHPAKHLPTQPNYMAVGTCHAIYPCVYFTRSDQRAIADATSAAATAYVLGRIDAPSWVAAGVASLVAYEVNSNLHGLCPSSKPIMKIWVDGPYFVYDGCHAADPYGPGSGNGGGGFGGGGGGGGGGGSWKLVA